MKKKAAFLVTTVFLISLLAVPIAQGATVLKKGAPPVIQKGQVIHDNLYIQGGNVAMEGTVLGDTAAMGGSVTLDGVTEGNAMVAGGTVTINGTVKDDLFVTGGTVIVKGKVGSDLRAAGGNVVIDGDIKGDVVVAGGTIELSSGSKVGGDVFCSGGNVRVAGKVKKSLRLSSGSTLVSGEVGSSADIKSDEIEILPSARIAGNLSYTSSKAAKIEKGALIGGRVQHISPSEEEKEEQAGFSPAAIFSYPIRQFLSLIAMLIVGGLLVLLFPKTMSIPIETVTRDLWKYLGIGLLLLFGVPVISIILLFTLIGLPLGLITLTLYAISIYIARILVGIYLGSKLLKLIKKDFATSAGWSLVIGLIFLTIISLASAIPFVGWLLVGLFNLAVAAVGLGAIAVVIKHAYPKVQEAMAKAI